MESGSGNKNSIFEVESSYEPICWVNHFGDNINRKRRGGVQIQFSWLWWVAPCSVIVKAPRFGSYLQNGKYLESNQIPVKHWSDVHETKMIKTLTKSKSEPALLLPFPALKLGVFPNHMGFWKEWKIGKEFIDLIFAHKWNREQQGALLPINMHKFTCWNGRKADRWTLGGDFTFPAQETVEI